eukprot:1128173-Lingulodinium_polyedra.AAC.1
MPDNASPIGTTVAVPSQIPYGFGRRLWQDRVTRARGAPGPLILLDVPAGVGTPCVAMRVFFGIGK